MRPGRKNWVDKRGRHVSRLIMTISPKANKMLDVLCAAYDLRRYEAVENAIMAYAKMAGLDNLIASTIDEIEDKNSGKTVKPKKDLHEKVSTPVISSPLVRKRSRDSSVQSVYRSGFSSGPGEGGDGSGGGEEPGDPVGHDGDSGT